MLVLGLLNKHGGIMNSLQGVILNFFVSAENPYERGDASEGEGLRGRIVPDVK